MNITALSFILYSTKLLSYYTHILLKSFVFGCDYNRIFYAQANFKENSLVPANRFFHDI